MWDYTEKMLTVRKKILWFKSISVQSIAEYIFSSHILRSAGAEAVLTDRASVLQSSMQAIS